MVILASLLLGAVLVSLTPLGRALPSESALAVLAAAGVLSVLLLTGRMA